MHTAFSIIALIALFNVYQCITVDLAEDSSDLDSVFESGKEWKGPRRERGKGERDGERRDRERDVVKAREGPKDGGKERRRAPPPQENAWSRGKPRVLASRDRSEDSDEKKQPPAPKKYEEPPQPVSQSMFVSVVVWDVMQHVLKTGL